MRPSSPTCSLLLATPKKLWGSTVSRRTPRGEAPRPLEPERPEAFVWQRQLTGLLGMVNLGALPTEEAHRHGVLRARMQLRAPNRHSDDRRPQGAHPHLGSWPAGHPP